MSRRVIIIVAAVAALVVAGISVYAVSNNKVQEPIPQPSIQVQEEKPEPVMQVQSLLQKFVKSLMKTVLNGRWVSLER